MVSNKVFTEDEEADFMVLVTMRVVQRFYKSQGYVGDNTPIPIATSPDPKMSEEEFKRYAQAK